MFNPLCFEFAAPATHIWGFYTQPKGPADALCAGWPRRLSCTSNEHSWVYHAAHVALDLVNPSCISRAQQPYI
jgi:hypothetical protein